MLALGPSVRTTVTHFVMCNLNLVRLTVKIIKQNDRDFQEVIIIDTP